MPLVTCQEGTELPTREIKWKAHPPRKDSERPHGDDALGNVTAITQKENQPVRPFPLRNMWLSNTLLVLLSTAALVSSSPLKRSLQPLPLSRNDRWIVDANNNKVPFVGINWPGAADTMLPEGLQYQSIANIVQKISQTGFNAVRLTFAIEMVDDILDNGGDVSLSGTLTTALGQENGTAILGKILRNNPQFTAQTTRLQVRSANYSCAELFADSTRFLTLWRENSRHKISISTSTTTFQKPDGVAA